MSDGTDVIEAGSGLVPADAAGGGVVPAGGAHAPSDDHDHPGPQQYVLIAVILVVLTAIEVAVSYLEGTGVGPNILILLLSSTAIAKFYLVCAWYMHMKQDNPIFRRMFVVGLVGAAIVYGIVLFTFASTVLQS